jgi:hypothetical protein
MSKQQNHSTNREDLFKQERITSMRSISTSVPPTTPPHKETKKRARGETEVSEPERKHVLTSTSASPDAPDTVFIIVKSGIHGVTTAWNPEKTQRSTYSAMSSTFSIETKDPKTEETVTTIAVLHITMPSKEKAADAFNHLNNLLIENGYLDADMSRPINWVAETNRLSPEEVKKVRNVGQNQLGRFAKTGTLIKVKDTQEPAPPRTASV